MTMKMEHANLYQGRDGIVLLCHCIVADVSQLLFWLTEIANISIDSFIIVPTAQACLGLTHKFALKRA